MMFGLQRELDPEEAMSVLDILATGGIMIGLLVLALLYTRRHGGGEDLD